MKSIVCAASLWALAFFTVSTGAQVAKSVNDGVYTAEQAERGMSVFDASCATCHDTPRFIGADFLAGWTGKPLHALFNHMATLMPEDQPGSLAPQQYADVTAYFLKLNGYPTGKEELKPSADTLKNIKFDKK